MSDSSYKPTFSDRLDSLSAAIRENADADLDKLLDVIEFNISQGDFEGNSFLPGAREMMNELLRRVPYEHWVSHARVYRLMLYIEYEITDEASLAARWEEISASPTYRKARMLSEREGDDSALLRMPPRKAPRREAAEVSRPAPELPRPEDEMRRRELQRRVDMRTFEMDGNTLVRYKGSADSLGIPTYIEAIADSAFENHETLWEVIIPAGVRTIGARAFGGCVALSDITLPDGVVSVARDAFADCPLSSATVPASAAAAVAAFELLSVEITSGTEIETGAFRDCENLAEVMLPDGLLSIGAEAFSGCYALSDITIPDSVTHVGACAFAGCSLATATVPAAAAASVGSVGLRSVDITSGRAIEANAFDGCCGLSEVTLPEELERIGAAAFRGCAELTSITIPDNVTSVADNAFEDCYIQEAVIPAIACAAVAGDPLFCVDITCGTEIVDEAFADCTNLQEVNMPPTLRRIGKEAFAACCFLTSITIPDSVVSVSDDAFSLCPLEDATIPACACRAVACDELETVTITSGSVIEDHAFEDCVALYEVHIAPSVTYIGAYAFAGCNSLESITIPVDCDFDETAFPDTCVVEIGD